MRSTIASKTFQESKYQLPIVLGKTIYNKTHVIDLAKTPHMLVAGATGQGKSVGINAILTSLLYKKHPAELKFVLIDPKKVELSIYSRIENHYLAKLPNEEEPIITDVQKVVATLNSLAKEMDARYDLLKNGHVRNIIEYNNKFINRKLNPDKGHRYLPYIVVVIDEFADLIMTAGKEVEHPIARIAQLARAIGIHLIVATQRPSTNVITGMIKANFPTRVAFRVTQMIDSRTILDSPGANQLIGRGDMLVSQGGGEMVRLQCPFVDTPEVEELVKFLQKPHHKFVKAVFALTSSDAKAEFLLQLKFVKAVFALTSSGAIGVSLQFKFVKAVFALTSSDVKPETRLQFKFVKAVFALTSSELIVVLEQFNTVKTLFALTSSDVIPV